eukprot:TRINITY_DN2486_c0_g1_i1.p2 TRINITY_DN2486_c0_g1~~TRINITY_DN2486_c0_g1_i1.p2  ORF type:complete len:200 (-),score=34.72 TRINITY_DN2486_c0_g1_i1:3-602(-)
MMKIVIALAFLFVLVACEPTKPVWPNAFSATVAVKGEHRHPTLFRWFYDFGVKKDRFDGIVRWQDEPYFSKVIFDHTTQEETTIFHQEDQVACYVSAINSSMPHPAFTNVKFIGEALIDYVPVYHWIEDSEHHSYQVFDYQDASREIKRIDVHDKRTRFTSTWTFHEMDKGRQDPTLFLIPAPISSVCNKVETSPLNLF